MYKEFLIIGERPDHSDTKVYWLDTEEEALHDARALREQGYDVEGYRERVTEVLDLDRGRFLAV